MSILFYILMLLLGGPVEEPLPTPEQLEPTVLQLECAEIVLHAEPLSPNVTDGYKIQRAIQENGGSRTVTLEDGTYCAL